MASNYRTASGKMIDLDAIRLQNEEVIAVGNMNVNARGDQLGAGGKVVKDRNQRMNEEYKLHSMVPKSAPIATSAKQAARDARGDNSVLATPEVIKTAPVQPQVKVMPAATVEDTVVDETKPVRGALASAVAKSAETTDEPAVKKTSGVRRL